MQYSLPAGQSGSILVSDGKLPRWRSPDEFDVFWCMKYRDKCDILTRDKVFNYERIYWLCNFLYKLKICR